MDFVQAIIDLFLDETVKGWARVAIFAILAFSVLAWNYTRTLKSDLKAVKNEFSTNSGSTMKDALDRLEKKLGTVSDQLDDQSERITKLEKHTKKGFAKWLD